MGGFSSETYKENAYANLAAVDIGSHTARLLVSRWSKNTGVLKPLLRKRAYIRLAKDFEVTEARRIKPDAIERTLRVLGDFVRSTGELEVGRPLAVATGVVREAVNQAVFLDAFVVVIQDSVRFQLLQHIVHLRQRERGMLFLPLFAESIELFGDGANLRF